MGSIFAKFDDIFGIFGILGGRGSILGSGGVRDPPGGPFIPFLGLRGVPGRVHFGVRGGRFWGPGVIFGSPGGRGRFWVLGGSRFGVPDHQNGGSE
jgi:hypothetical protein